MGFPDLKQADPVSVEADYQLLCLIPILALIDLILFLRIQTLSVAKAVAFSNIFSAMSNAFCYMQINI